VPERAIKPKSVEQSIAISVKGSGICPNSVGSVKDVAEMVIWRRHVERNIVMLAIDTGTLQNDAFQSFSV
jgi:hypothetical protein